MVFADRAEAGKKLAEKLKIFAGRPDVMLFALPRGGAVVGEKVAKALNLPLDLIVTRKIGAPSNPEYAIGALAETGELVWNEAERAAADPRAIRKIISDETEEAARRVKIYRHGRSLPDMEGKTVLIIDDGLATGLTMRAAIAAARHQHANKIIVVVPHGARDSLDAIRKEVDEVVVLYEPEWYGAVGEFYETFPQVEDEEVLTIMKAYGPK